MELEIREANSQDLPAILELNRRAFGSEAEASLILALEEDGHVRSSLLAIADSKILGNVLFSEIEIVTDERSLPALALAPVAVDPEHQGLGIGGALIRAGLEKCRQLGFSAVFVLGEPDFYRKFGFTAALAEKFHSPYSGPYFMALELFPGFLKDEKGRVIYSRPFLSLEG